MSEPYVPAETLTEPEIRLLWMLDAADTALIFDGRLKWSLDADDLCELIEIALELPEMIPGGVEGVRGRVAELLGLTDPPPTRTEIAACWSDNFPLPMSSPEPCP